MHLLRPDEAMSNAVMYEAGYAAMKTGVDLIMLMQMPNHEHDIVEDPLGNVPAFNENFHKLVAKVGNVMRDRTQNFFDSEPTCVVRLETLEDLIRKVVYVATNPVRAGLVERAKEWPGASGYAALITGKPVRAYRPKAFHSSRSKVMPEVIDVSFRIPERFGDPAPIIEEIVRRVTRIEENEIRERRCRGIPVVGRYRVMRRSPFEKPAEPKKRSDISPTIAAIDSQTRFEAIDRLRCFRRRYRAARAAMRAGTPIPFPHGTYWLARHVGVVVLPAEKTN